jgi:hypothetical protein
MTSKAALCKALLDGMVVNIKNGFHLFGITNIPREIGRSIERDGSVTKNPNDNGFGVEVSRTEKTGKSRYGQKCEWTDYRLNRIYNAPGIKKNYVAEQMAGSFPGPEEITQPNYSLKKMTNRQCTTLFFMTYLYQRTIIMP